MKPLEFEISLSVKTYEKILLKIAEIATMPKKYSSRDKPSKSVTVQPSHFIVLNNIASPKMPIKIYFNFCDFLKILILVEVTYIYDCQ